MLIRGQLRSSWHPLVFRHSLACQASQHQRSSASRSFSSEFSQQKPLVGTTPILSSSSDFAHLAGRGMFVDKSPALQDFLHHDMPVHLLLRPRRSGKTTLLSMFHNFFECASPDERARRKGLFIKNNLAITKDTMFEKEFGKYPVLYVDFSNVIGSTMAKLLQNFRNHVTDTVLRLEDSGFFQNRGKLPKNQLEFLEAVLKGTVPDSQLHAVLFKLTEFFHVLHQKQVVVLIDEYDTPTSYAVQDRFFPEVCRQGPNVFPAQANEFFRLVFSTLLKNNKHIRGALLVGILRVAKSSWLSGVNNILVFPLGQSSEYSTACMFTEDETRRLYDRQVGLQKPSFEFDDLNKWYNGYSTENGTKLFSPWSISNALTTGKLTTWWNKSGYDATIQSRVLELLGSDYEFRAQCQTLLNGDEIDIQIRNIDYTSVPNMSRDELWTLMYYAGYLTMSDITLDASASVRIPNTEIQSEFRGWNRQDFHSRMTPELSETSVGQFNLMVNGHFAEFAESFGNFFFREAPPRIFGGRELVYQEYVYAYFSSAARALKVRPKWTIKMEVGAGLGRADVVFYQDEGVVIEVKRIPHDEKEGYREQERKQLSSATKEALLQCDTRHYRSMMPEHVNVIFEYGLAFLGPYCAVEARVLKKENGTWVTHGVYTADEDEKRRQRTYCVDGSISDSSTTSKKGLGGSRNRDSLMVATDAITARNLFAKFYLTTHVPTVAEFADIWNNLDHETVEKWKTKARQMKKSRKEKKKLHKESAD